MKSKKKVRGSFFTLLLKGYVIFTIVLVMVIFSIFIGSVYGFVKIVEKEESEGIQDYKIVLEEGKYEELPIEKVAGKGSYFAIVNESNEIIYKSKLGVEYNILNMDELEHVPRYDASYSSYVSEFENSKGEKRISLNIEEKNELEEAFDYRFILDESLNIIYESVDTGKSKFTEREFLLLTNTLDDDYKIYRYPFKSENGQSYTIIIYEMSERFTSLIENFKKLCSIAVKTFIISYCILIGLLIIWLQKKVKRPLNILQEALSKFSKRDTGEQISYEGTNEFVEICDSFNDMSQRLHKSECERIKAEEKKKKMLADISHDLKTPITVIQGYARAVCDNLVPEEEKNQYLMTISKKADLLNELINTFHDYSKMDHPDYILNLEPEDIVVFLRDYIADKYNEFELEDFDLIIEIPEKHVICDIDKFQLKRVFDNLISNSIKYNKKGTTIICSLTILSDSVRIIIGDNGVGIADDFKDDIFEPFMVGEKSRNKYSSGLGLAICKKIIEAHDGKIALISNSASEFKTEFEIILPIK